MAIGFILRQSLDHAAKEDGIRKYLHSTVNANS